MLQVVFAGWHKTGRIDLEAVESLIRESMHAAGAKTIERLLAVPVVHQTGVACACGHQARYHERRRKQVLTILDR